MRSARLLLVDSGRGLSDEIEAALKGMLKPIFEEKTQGTAEIREVFRSSKFGTIAGCMVTDLSLIHI